MVMEKKAKLSKLITRVAYVPKRDNKDFKEGLRNIKKYCPKQPKRPDGGF